MGKTKTFIVEGQLEPKKSGKEAYEEKMRKKAAAAKAEEKAKVEKVGLKGGERIKVVGGDDIQTTATPETEDVKSSNQEPSQEKWAKKKKVRSQKYLSAKSKYNPEKVYPLPEAIKLLREISYAKFDPTVELHIQVKNSPININVSLPHSSGKKKRVEIASPKTIDKLKSGIIDFDLLLSTPDMMPKLFPFAKILGPKGLMPNPKNGTIIKDEKEAEKFQGNLINLKTQKDTNIIHTVIGKLSLKDKELEENAKAIFDALKDKVVVKVFLKSTMSPSIKVGI
jgi:large subunit ribosomal protein L1